MPTRIRITKLEVPPLKSVPVTNTAVAETSSVAAPPIPTTTRSIHNSNHNNDDHDDDHHDVFVRDATIPPPPPPLPLVPSQHPAVVFDSTLPPPTSAKTPRRYHSSRLPKVRSSLLRELNVRGCDDDNNNGNNSNNQNYTTANTSFNSLRRSTKRPRGNITTTGTTTTTSAAAAGTNNNNSDADEDEDHEDPAVVVTTTTTTAATTSTPTLTTVAASNHHNSHHSSNSSSSNNNNTHGDIRGSPRLLGYLFSTIASAVMLVSVVQFYRQRNISSTTTAIETNYNNIDYYYFFNGVIVYRWKLWGAILVSSIGAALSVLTMYVHFDTILAPELWYRYLQNGSVVEQYWIIGLMIFWSMGLHICTSTLSVGESQANVYFATWIAFGSTVMNYGVWCESAHVQYIKIPNFLLLHTSNHHNQSNHHPRHQQQHPLGHRSAIPLTPTNDDSHTPTNNSDPLTTLPSSTLTANSNGNSNNNRNTTTTTVPDDPTTGTKEGDDTNFRETTYNWLWVGFFSCIFAGASTDIYWNRHNIILRFRGDALTLVQSDWVVILSVVWSEVALCGFAIAMNYCTSCSNTKIIQQPLSYRLPSFLITRNDDNRTDNTATATTNSNQYNHERYICVFGWRQMEGLLILMSTGLKFWVILRYAAVDGVIPGLSNAYFGVWGSFFNGVFCFGTWLREHQNMEFIVRE
jgi:hypothetical protein